MKKIYLALIHCLIIFGPTFIPLSGGAGPNVVFEEGGGGNGPFSNTEANIPEEELEKILIMSAPRFGLTLSEITKAYGAGYVSIVTTGYHRYRVSFGGTSIDLITDI